MQKTQLAVIGAGPGGYAAAFYAADMGMQVTLIDKEKHPGGVCLYRGCIPSKALLHLAKLINETKESHKWGVSYDAPKIDLDKVRGWKQGIIEKQVSGLGMLSRQRKINYVQGTAEFTSSSSLKVDKTAGGTEEINFEHCIIATGSVIATIPQLMINSKRLLNSTSALDLPAIPKSLLVIGGGYIGLELGSVYQALGSEVSVVEMTPGLLPGADRDLVFFLEKMVKAKFKNIMLNSRVTSITEANEGLNVTIADKDGKTTDYFYDYVLMSIGRKPITQGLGLEHTKVTVSPRGFIEIDEQRRTRDNAIYAIGDIAGDPMLAHKASHEARTAVEAILGHKAAFNPHAIPAVVFTDPEIAWAGVTELQAKEMGLKYEVAKFPWAASGRATTLDRNDGVTKLIIDKNSQRILGVGICGAGAGELIAEGVLAIEMGATAEDLKLSIHPHPTLSETVMEAAEVFFGQSSHFYKPKK